MKALVDEIISYITYLKITYKMTISMHFCKETMLKLYNSEASRLMNYNSHINPYCLCVKSDSHLHRKCIICQQLVLKKCNSESFFEGVCHGGVREYIFRVLHKSNAVGFVSVSGYAASGRELTGDEKMRQLYRKSMRQADDSEICGKLIPPLCRMLELIAVYTDEIPRNSANSEYNELVSYLTEHYTTASLESICNEFHRSRSHISHLFKKNSKMTIKKFCNILKINDAKELLLSTNLSVTEISSAVGFNDFSYFISFFKKTTGASPLVWRKEQRLKNRSI